MKKNFTKMQALGNDFVFFDATRSPLKLTPKLVRQISNRRFGIGCDQLLVLGKSRRADFKMTIFNADGGQVEMCGNGLRALARFVRDKKLSNKKELSVETKAGIQHTAFVSKKNIRVNMGSPILKGKEIPVNLSGRIINRPLRMEGRDFRITCVSVGNPHCVIFVNDVEDYPVEKYGSVLETHNLFPKKINVEFVQPIDKKHIKLRVWERGAGLTEACGSGACAAVVAGVLNNYAERKVQVDLPGGRLEIHWNLDDDCVYMTGTADKVFEGMIEL